MIRLTYWVTLFAYLGNIVLLITAAIAGEWKVVVLFGLLAFLLHETCTNLWSQI